MKTILAIITSLAFAAAPALANGGSNSTSTSQVQNTTTVAAGAAIDNRSYGSKIPSSTTVRTTGQANAPAMMGGGHPCLSAKSGGLGIIGGSVSYGESNPEPICMLKLLGQDEAAIRLLAATDLGACRALVAAGAIQSTCGAPEPTPKPRASARSSYAFSKCERRGGKIYVTVAAGADQKLASAQCSAQLN